MGKALEHRRGPRRSAADHRYLRFATPRHTSPTEPGAAGSIRACASGLPDKSLTLFNIAGLDATMAACPPRCSGFQRRRATPIFMTTSARLGRRRPSPEPALGRRSICGASMSPMTGPTGCRSVRPSSTYSRSISVRSSTSCWARKTDSVNGGPA